jgi:hypothetical protein
MNWAGMYAVILRQQGMLPQTHILICPASSLADRPDVLVVPTPGELVALPAEQLARLRKIMGGSYGYSLGFYVNGLYQSPQDLRRATQALMADAPSPTEPLRHSLNHEGRGQNVLFEDLHVQFLPSCKAKGCSDHIFVNDEGRPYAGLHLGDSVIGASEDRPLVTPVAIEAR